MREASVKKPKRRKSNKKTRRREQQVRKAPPVPKVGSRWTLSENVSELFSGNLFKSIEADEILSESQLQEIREQLQKAIKDKDSEMKEELLETKLDFEAKLFRFQDERRKMQVEKEQLFQQIRQKHEEAIQALISEIQEKDRLVEEIKNETVQLRQKNNEDDMELEKIRLQWKLKHQYYNMVYANRCTVM